MYLQSICCRFDLFYLQPTTVYNLPDHWGLFSILVWHIRLTFHLGIMRCNTLWKSFKAPAVSHTVYNICVSALLFSLLPHTETSMESNLNKVIGSTDRKTNQQPAKDFPNNHVYKLQQHFSNISRSLLGLNIAAVKPPGEPKIQYGILALFLFSWNICSLTWMFLLFYRNKAIQNDTLHRTTTWPQTDQEVPVV